MGQGLGALLRELRDLSDRRPPRASYTTYSFINLLVDARLTPAQRAALLDGLATDPRARDLGPLAPSYRLIFDRNTSEILESSMTARPHRPGELAAWEPGRVETVLETGYVDAIRDRPR